MNISKKYLFHSFIVAFHQDFFHLFLSESCTFLIGFARQDSSGFWGCWSFSDFSAWSIRILSHRKLWLLIWEIHRNVLLFNQIKIIWALTLFGYQVLFRTSYQIYVVKPHINWFLENSNLKALNIEIGFKIHYFAMKLVQTVYS